LLAKLLKLHSSYHRQNKFSTSTLKQLRLPCIQAKNGNLFKRHLMKKESLKL